MAEEANEVHQQSLRAIDKALGLDAADPEAESRTAKRRRHGHRVQDPGNVAYDLTRDDQGNVVTSSITTPEPDLASETELIPVNSRFRQPFYDADLSELYIYAKFEHEQSAESTKSKEPVGLSKTSGTAQCRVQKSRKPAARRPGTRSYAKNKGFIYLSLNMDKRRELYVSWDDKRNIECKMQDLRTSGCHRVSDPGVFYQKQS